MKYYGQYCQCSNFDCDRSNTKLCGGTRKYNTISVKITNVELQPGPERDEVNPGRSRIGHNNIYNRCLHEIGPV